MKRPDFIRICNSPAIKRIPLFGVFLRWPEDGEDWIHPFDIGVARHLLPGNRVFRRDDCDADYYLYSYGELSFRAKPKLWMLLEHEGFEVGDTVQIKSQFGSAWPCITTICDIHWDQPTRQILYQVEGFGRFPSRRFTATDFEMVQTIHREDNS